MIRRLYLFQPLTDEEATAANAWAAKLGDDSLRLTHVSSPTRLRVLLFDGVNKIGKKRRSRSIIDRPGDAAVAALRTAVSTNCVVFNIVTGRLRVEGDETPQGNTHDAIFTVALPNGSACAFLRRCGFGYSAASIAANCMWVTGAMPPDRPPSEDARALFWPINRPPDRRACEVRVIEFAERLLAEVPGF